MSNDPVNSIHASAGANDRKSHVLDGAIGPANDMQEFHDRAELPDDIGEDAYPWHQLRCRETALFIEETY